MCDPYLTGSCQGIRHPDPALRCGAGHGLFIFRTSTDCCVCYWFAPQISKCEIKKSQALENIDE